MNQMPSEIVSLFKEENNHYNVMAMATERIWRSGHPINSCEGRWLTEEEKRVGATK